MTPVRPSQSPKDIAARARLHLEEVVRIESSSDETSDTIPSTPGQAHLADHLADFFEGLGAIIERDAHANVIATLPGRGPLADAEPLALMIHVDTARGTHPVDGLVLHPAWDGEPLTYPANPGLQVSVANYPALRDSFLGHDLLHGPGDAPFGLDDKLGLTHMMTLAWLLHTNPEIPHRPLIFIGRPDEEIGRMEALLGIADLLASRGVRSGYTVDGIEPYEINVENFNASQGSVWFDARPTTLSGGRAVEVFIGGVNTHGATAKAEGHRPATRLASEIFRTLDPARVLPVAFASDALRDCDALLTVFVKDDAAERELEAALRAVVGPHEPLGASWRTSPTDAVDTAEGAVLDALAFVHTFLHSDPGFVLSAEDSEGHQGYSQPYRIINEDGGLRLDVRIRDFTPEGLSKREDHLRAVVAGGRKLTVRAQYINMGPKLAERPDLLDLARAAGESVGVDCRKLPIRGGTGVDPFLERGVAIANLGTGYFAPESEKEFTSLQHMSGHALWLTSLVQQA